VPLGSLREEFLFLRGNLFQGGFGEKEPWMKKLKLLSFVYSTHKKLDNEVGVDGNS